MSSSGGCHGASAQTGSKVWDQALVLDREEAAALKTWLCRHRRGQSCISGKKRKIWGVAETWVCQMQPVWGHSPHRVSCSVSMAAALFPLAFAGGKGTALKIIAQFLIFSRIRFTYSAWEGCCVLPTWGCKTHFLGGIHTCAHSFSGSAISCVRPQPKKTREASTPARGVCLNRHKLNDVPI